MIMDQTMAGCVLLIALLLVVSSSDQVAMASDPGQLQDFCVANKTSNVLVNGFVCKNPKLVMADDFFFRGLDKAGDTNNNVGSVVTPVNVNQIAGLNTLGISVARVDFAPRGLNPPHVHLRASEVLTVLEGSLYVGFVTSSPENKLFAKVLKRGDVFVFPQGLIHFEINRSSKRAVALAALSSQNPGVIPVASSLVGSKPAIADDVLAKALQVDKMTVGAIKSKF